MPRSDKRPDPRRQNGAARDRVRRKVYREEDICHLCGQLVDKTLPAGLPASPELDELIPVSRDGDPFDRNNVKLAHRICNQRRGNKPLVTAEPNRAPLTTQRRWETP